MTMSQRKYLQAILVNFSILLFYLFIVNMPHWFLFPLFVFGVCVLGEEELHSNLVYQELTENQEVACI